MSGLGVDSIGAYPSFYGTDSLTQAQYAQLLKQYEQAAAASPTDSATQTMTTQRSVSPRYTKEESHTLRNALILAGAATLIYAAHRGGGITHIGKGFKEIGKSISNGWNKLWGKTSSVTESVTKELKAVVKDGKVESVMIPGKTQTLSVAEGATEANIRTFAKNNNIDINTLLKPSKKNIKALAGGEFILEGRFVQFEGDKIVKVLENGGKDVTDQVLGKIGEHADFATKAQEFITNARKLNKGWNRGLVSADLTTQVGDDMLTVRRILQTISSPKTADGKAEFYKGIAKKANEITPEIRSLTTLERFAPTSDALTKYFEKHPDMKKAYEEVVKNGTFFSGSNAGLVKLNGTDGVLKGKTFYYKNGNIVGYTESGHYHSSKSKEFKDFFNTGNNETAINNLYSDSMQAGKKIPDSVYGVFSLA